MGSSGTVSHSLSFQVPIAGIESGYTKSLTMSYTSKFWLEGVGAIYIYREYYAATYWNDYERRIVKTGITAERPHSEWSSASTSEYLDPNNLPTEDWVEFTVAAHSSRAWEYQETGSWTWTAGDAAAPFAIVYETFNKLLSIDVTVTVAEGTTVAVGYEIFNPTDRDLKFRLYTAGAQPIDAKKIAGIEFHIWEV